MARHLIIGGGTAGLNAIRTIREEDGGGSEITLVSMERPIRGWSCRTTSGETISESHVFTATPGLARGVEGQDPDRAQGGRRSTPRPIRVTLDDGSAVEYDDCLDRHRLAGGTAAHPGRGRAGRAIPSGRWTRRGM